jgi:hypothetical protein
MAESVDIFATTFAVTSKDFCFVEIPFLVYHKQTFQYGMKDLNYRS